MSGLGRGDRSMLSSAGLLSEEKWAFLMQSFNERFLISPYVRGGTVEQHYPSGQKLDDLPSDRRLWSEPMIGRGMLFLWPKFGRLAPPVTDSGLGHK